jgi:hypothetical protein
LVSYYKLDETSGTTAVDSHGSNDATLSGEVTFNENGFINYGVLFNTGNTNEREINIGNLLNSNSWSYNTWAKPNSLSTLAIDSVGDSSIIFESWEASNQKIFFGLRTTGYQISIYNSSGTRIDFLKAITNSNDVWAMWSITYDSDNLKVYKNGVLVETHSAGTIRQNSFNYLLGRSSATQYRYKGYMDEVGIWSKALSAEDVNALYDEGNGFAYPFITNSVDANFDYVVDQDLNLLILEDTSTVIGDTEITDWNWIIDDVLVSNNQDYNFSITETTDYNVCLFVDTNVADVNDTQCYSINTGDWTPPTTSFSSEQVSGTTDQNITLTCTDNNSGCQYINFRINNGDWNYYLIGDNPLSIIYSGTGDHNIQYFSTDNADNNESIKTSFFTTYGLAKFTLKDENSGLDLDDVTYTISPSINGDSGGTLTGTNELDLNLQGITSTEYTFTFSKTDYGTRTYSLNMTEFSDIDINFGLLPDSQGRNIEFQVYKTNGTTLYSNTYIQFYNWNKQQIVGRKLSDSEGKVTFFLNPNDANYTLTAFGTPQADYNAVVLTVNKPKDETTGLTISNNWNLVVGGLAWQNYLGLTGTSQVIQVYANTVGDYELAVSDVNNDYFERKYYVSYLGGTTAETLQPYLVPTAEAISTTIYTISGFTQQPVGGVTIKVYKQIVNVGRVLVEQITTDDKGEGLVSLIANSSYEFEVYVSGTPQGTLNIVATSASIYINIDDITIVDGELGSGFVTVRFTPNRGRLMASDVVLSQIISITDKDLLLTFTSARIIVTNTDVNGVFGNDVNIYDQTITTLTNNIDINSTAQTLNNVAYDTNGHLIVTVIVTTNQGTFIAKYIYKPLSGFDVYKVIGYDLRPFFGCTATTNPLIPCGPMLLIAIFISILITIGFVIETGFSGQTTTAGIFLVVMGIFTYFAWVPIGIMAIMVVGFIMIGLALGGKQV